MPIVKVQKLPKKKSASFQSILYSFCYFFPQYTYNEARLLPAKRVISMLNAARREKAREYLNLLRIATAPHTDKGTGVKNLTEEFSDIING